MSITYASTDDIPMRPVCSSLSIIAFYRPESCPRRSERPWVLALPAPRPLTEDDIRRIIREELQAAGVGMFNRPDPRSMPGNKLTFYDSALDSVQFYHADEETPSDGC